MRGSLALAAMIAAAVWPQAASAAPWCGTVATSDRPALVGGHHVRVLYAVPSDGADRSAELAPQISDDVDQMDAWWRANDSARTLRLDVVLFPCGPQADINIVRLARSSTELQQDETRFDLIFGDPAVRRQFDGYTKLLVYYDGPVADADLCGQGGGEAEGIGISIVYLAGCSGVPTAPVATHELLHGFGAVPEEAPNGCADSGSHVCDSEADIMWPYATGTPLSSFALDSGRDDYYAHGGGWLDVRNSSWLRHLDAQAPLAVAVSGRGSVRSDVPGIAGCASSCQVEFNAGTTVGLEATPAAGQRFRSWSGGCTGAATRCTATVNGPTTVTALFAPATFRLAVSARGKGRVTSPVGIFCPGVTCARNVTSFVRVVLRATPAPGWKLKAWTGACRGAKLTCSVPMTAPASARATFVRKAA